MTDAEVQNLMAIAWGQYQKSDFSAAEKIYAQVLSIQPDNVDALHLRGVALFQLQRYQVAYNFLHFACKLKPSDASIFSNAGLVLRALKRFPEALLAYDSALALLPDFAQAWANRGNVLRDMGSAQAAVESYQKALALQADFPQAWHGLGLALSDLKRWLESVAAFEQAIALKLDYAVAYMDRGNAFRELERIEDALKSYDKALALDANYAKAWSNRGVVLKNLERFDEAQTSYQRAITLQPDFVDAMVNYATLLKDVLNIPQAIALNERAIGLDPASSGAHLNLSICHLLLGQFEQGLPHYEWRWKTEQLRDGVRSFQQPLWLGDADLAGKTILLHAEQGLGDTIQFCRYAPMVSALGAKVVLEVQPPLMELMKTLPGVDVLVARGQPLPHFDLHCPLLSLPLAFKTELTTIPVGLRYLVPEQQKVEHWQQLLGAGTLQRVGLVWSGRPEHKNDHNRSIPFAEFAACLKPDIEYHCLQKEIRSSDQPALDAHPQVRQWSQHLHSFADTAALVECMDYVIAVDTSVAHLAAALGKPVQLLLPYSPDWRWIVGRDDSPWYPGMQLFRQTSSRLWNQVLRLIGQGYAK